MSNIKSGAAVGSISVEDKTAQGLKSAQDRFKTFGDEMNKLEERMRPMQEIMKGGMAVGGMTAGFGLLLEHSSRLNNSLQGLSGNLSSLEQTTGGATGAIQNLIKTMTINPIVAWGTAIGGIATAGMAFVEMGKQIFKGLKALAFYIGNFNEAVKAHIAATTASATATTADAAAKTASATATTADAAAKTAGATATTADAAATVADTIATGEAASATVASTAATVTDTTATVASAAATNNNALAKVLVTSVIYGEIEARTLLAGAVTKEAMTLAALASIQTATNGTTAMGAAGTSIQTVALAANTGGIVANSGAKSAGAALSVIDVVATTASTKAKTANTGATAASTIATTASSIALGIYTWTCAAAAVAVNYLTASLGVNPFTAWLIAIGAIVAGLAAIGYGIYAFCKSGKEKTKTLRDISDEANKTAEANKKMADSIKTSNDLITAKYERLKQLSKKNYISSDELKEAQEITIEMRMDYGVRGGYSDEEGWKDFTSVDDLRMKIAAEAKIRNNLYAQLRALQAADNGALTKEEAIDNRKRQNEIELELLKMRIAAEKDIEENAKKRAEAEEAAAKAVLDAQKAKEQVISRGLELQKSLQREIDDQDKTALEKELQGLKDRLAARVEELKIAVQKNEITKKEASDEWKATNAILELRKKQIEERYEQTKQKAERSFYGVYEAKEQDRADKKRYALQDENLSNQISENPIAAMDLINRQLGASKNALSEAQKRLEEKMNEIKNGTYLGNLDDRKAAAAALEKERDNLMARVDKMTQLSKTAENEIQQGVKDMLSKSRNAEATPIDAARKGSAESFKQAMENRARAAGAKSPEAAETEKLAKQLQKQYEEEKRKKEKEIELTKEIVNSLAGAGV